MIDDRGDEVGRRHLVARRGDGDDAADQAACHRAAEQVAADGHAHGLETRDRVFTAHERPDVEFESLDGAGDGQLRQTLDGLHVGRHDQPEVAGVGVEVPPLDADLSGTDGQPVGPLELLGIQAFGTEEDAEAGPRLDGAVLQQAEVADLAAERQRARGYRRFQGVEPDHRIDAGGRRVDDEVFGVDFQEVSERQIALIHLQGKPGRHVVGELERGPDRLAVAVRPVVQVHLKLLAREEQRGVGRHEKAAVHVHPEGRAEGDVDVLHPGSHILQPHDRANIVHSGLGQAGLAQVEAVAAHGQAGNGGAADISAGARIDGLRRPRVLLHPTGEPKLRNLDRGVIHPQHLLRVEGLLLIFGDRAVEVLIDQRVVADVHAAGFGLDDVLDLELCRADGDEEFARAALSVAGWADHRVDIEGPEQTLDLGLHLLVGVTPAELEAGLIDAQCDRADQRPLAGGVARLRRRQLELIHVEVGALEHERPEIDVGRGHRDPRADVDGLLRHERGAVDRDHAIRRGVALVAVDVGPGTRDVVERQLGVAEVLVDAEQIALVGVLGVVVFRVFVGQVVAVGVSREMDGRVEVGVFPAGAGEEELLAVVGDRVGVDLRAGGAGERDVDVATVVEHRHVDGADDGGQAGRPERVFRVSEAVRRTGVAEHVLAQELDGVERRVEQLEAAVVIHAEADDAAEVVGLDVACEE